MDDESRPLIDDRKPKLKDFDPPRRESSESVDMEISHPPPAMPLRYRILLMVILICSGASMTLSMKTQDQTCLSNCPETGNGTQTNSDSDADPGEPHYFHQPFIQLFHLGLGQIFSGVFYPLFRSKDPNLKPVPFIKFFPQAALASLFDVCAEVLIILGLSFTHASVTEMLKTTMVVFVGLLSLYFFPGFVIHWKQWIASGFMLLGSLIVILQSYILGGEEEQDLMEILGAFLVIGAQLFYGLEFVVEEKLMDHAKHDGHFVNKAILVFALGVLSMTGSIILQIPWTLITSDFPTLGHELQLYFQIPALWASGIGISLGVMGFDLAGLGISEEMGSDKRAISVAAFQVAIVWTIATLVGWESFSWMSFGGFIIILASGAVYVYYAKTKTEPHAQKKKKLKNADQLQSVDSLGHSDSHYQSVDPIRESINY